eukprot:NODE_1540_length_1498_cov_30.498965_g1389_i0.p1 GENE.NODE_1540_length_1498_cov_30.498965_g1389_i0~~NODE_1540_length_1498_cov_30.498965_g1389_i0.p1  ORF type:complete len:438 (+),score=109.00 NODE_1540_length_1498_cov_30.498965_g1389_i0:75-1316(+)
MNTRVLHVLSASDLPFAAVSPGSKLFVMVTTETFRKCTTLKPTASSVTWDESFHFLCNGKQDNLEVQLLTQNEQSQTSIVGSGSSLFNDSSSDIAVNLVDGSGVGVGKVLVRIANQKGQSGKGNASRSATAGGLPQGSNAHLNWEGVLHQQLELIHSLREELQARFDEPQGREKELQDRVATLEMECNGLRSQLSSMVDKQAILDLSCELTDVKDTSARAHEEHLQTAAASQSATQALVAKLEVARAERECLEIDLQKAEIRHHLEIAQKNLKIHQLESVVDDLHERCERLARRTYIGQENAELEALRAGARFSETACQTDLGESDQIKRLANAERRLAWSDSELQQLENANKRLMAENTLLKTEKQQHQSEMSKLVAFNNQLRDQLNRAVAELDEKQFRAGIHASQPKSRRK